MRDFLNLMGSEPEIAAVPVMIDSSKWEVLETGLRVVQGKSVVNSISLKEGKQEFLHRARLIRRYGAAAVVMLFDEQGQADTYARKIEVAQRAYKLLTDDGFPAEDIIFDPNILAVATGIEAHDAYARDFIEAVRWIKQNLPHAKISGRRVESLVRLPGQQRRARGHAFGVSLPRHPSGYGHGDRQSPDAANLQRHRTGTARTSRGCHPLPPRRRSRTPHGIRFAIHQNRRDADAAYRRLALGAARQAHRIRHAQGRGRLHRAGRARRLPHAGLAPGSDRPAADAGHGSRRQSVRAGQNVPAASGQDRPRDEKKPSPY